MLWDLLLALVAGVAWGVFLVESVGGLGGDASSVEALIVSSVRPSRFLDHVNTALKYTKHYSPPPRPACNAARSLSDSCMCC